MSANKIFADAWEKINSIYLPTYCIQNLFMSKNSSAVATGVTRKVINNGPRKLLGTTPGNSRWSYWKQMKSRPIQVHLQEWHFNAYLGYVQPMVQQVMNCLQIEALLHLCERRVDTVGSCNQEHQQGHRCVIFGFLLPLTLERICRFKSIKNGCNKHCSNSTKSNLPLSFDWLPFFSVTRSDITRRIQNHRITP